MEHLKDFNPFTGRLPVLGIYHTYTGWDWQLVKEYRPGESVWNFYDDYTYINREGSLWYNGSVVGFDPKSPEKEGRYLYIPEISTIKIVFPLPPVEYSDREMWNREDYEYLLLVNLPGDGTIRCTDCNSRRPNLLYILRRSNRR